MNKVLYIANDQLYHTFTLWSSEQKARAHIEKWGKVGFIEIFELKEDDYYYFKEFIPFKGKNNDGVIFGRELTFGNLRGRVHKNIIPVIFNNIDSAIDIIGFKGETN